MTNTQTASPVCFALIGCGAIAKTQIRAIQELGDDHARITTVCDILAERADALAEEFDLAVADFDTICRNSAIHAVTICTPSGTHVELAERALRAGKHVIIEKPMDVSVAACTRLRQLAAANTSRLAIISQHRWDPASQVVHNAITAGKLGRLLFTEARIPWFRTQEYYDSGDWRGTWEMDGGGCLTNQGIHTVDLMLWLAGPVRRVHATMQTIAHERIEVEDLITATLEFESGMLGTLMASTSLYPGFPITLGIHGTEGSAVIEGDELHTLAIKGEETARGSGANAHAIQVATGGTRSASHEADKGSDETWKWGDAHREQLRDFIRCIHDGSTPLVNAQQGLNAVALIQACYQSARSGDWAAVEK